MPGSIWTPQGEVPTAERGVEPLTRQEIIVFSQMQEVAQHHDIELRCRRCDRSITGQNNDSSKVLAVSCQCRELRYDGR